MKKLLIGLFVGAFATLPLLTLAAQFKANDTVTIGQEPAGQNSYVIGGTVDAAGVIDGDLLAAGRDIAVSGMVNRDALLIGSTIIVSNEVKEDLRVAGADVMVSGRVGAELSAAGGTVSVMPGGQVGGDVHLAGGEVAFEGVTAGSLVIYGGEVFINGAVAKDVVIKRAASVRIGPNAVIQGTLHYRAPEEATIASGASLLGGTTFEQMARDEDRGDKSGLAGIFTLWLLIKIVGGWILALLMLALWRPQVMAMQRDTRQNFWWRVLYGFCILVLVPIAAIIVMFTVVGIIPALIALLIYGALLLVAGIYMIITAASCLNEYVFRKRYGRLPWFMPLLGIIAIYIVCLIPFVGGLVVFIVFLAGLGTLARAVARLIKPEPSAGTV